MAFLSLIFTIPEFCNLYGGFTVTTSTFSKDLSNLILVKSPSTNLTLSSNLLYLDVLIAISTNSFWSSIPVTYFASVFPAKIKGIIPVPLHKSTTELFFLTLAKLANSTASTPNLKPSFFWIICIPFSCKSSRVSSSFINSIINPHF